MSNEITATSGPELYAQVLKSKQCCIFPAPVYTLEKPLTVPSGAVWEGAGMMNTVFNITGDFPAFRAQRAKGDTTGRTMFVTLRQLGAQGLAGNTTPLLDLRGTSYLTLENLRLQGGKSSGPVIDNTRGTASYCGFVDLINVYAGFGTIGYRGEVNQLTIRGGHYNGNSLWGIWLSRSNCVSISNAEVGCVGTEHVQATYIGKYPDGHYDRGGILLESVTRLTASGIWFEGNAHRDKLYSRNDVDNDSKCSELDIRRCRWDKNPGPKPHYLGLDWGQHYE